MIKKFGKDLFTTINFDLNLFLLNFFQINFVYLFFELRRLKGLLENSQNNICLLETKVNKQNRHNLMPILEDAKENVITKDNENVKIDRNPRSWEKASDHTPVILELNN